MTPTEDKYKFISDEIAKHPQLQQWTSVELLAKESDLDFWEELYGRLDCLRICNACHKPMIEGFCIDDGREHYCSEECLHTTYSDEEYEAMSNDENGNSYWTVWWE